LKPLNDPEVPPGPQSTLHQILVSRHIGGAAVVAIRLANAARTRGFRCTAWVPGRGAASDALDRAGVDWHTYDFDGLRRQRAVRRLAACARMFPKLARRPRPIVHVHNPVVFGLLRPALLAVRARSVVHFHTEPSTDEIEWAARCRPSHIVACARHVAERIETVLAARSWPTPVTAVPNAVDLERFVPGDPATTRANLGMPTNRFVVLMLANLAPNKGQATTLRAVELLVRRGLDVECWLAGEDRGSGDHEQELRALCAELRLKDRVRFLGFRWDSPLLLQAADAFLLPSTLEGLPLSVLEAQAAHVPVVASTIPGVREVVEDGRTGFLIPADDFVGYAARLEDLFRNNGLRQRITAAAAALVASKYNWEALEQRVFQIYETLVT